MQTASEAPRAASSFRWKWLGRALAYFVLLWFLLAIAGMDGLLALPFHFFFGWVAHGIAVLRHRSLSLPHAAIFAACLVGFVSGFHLFAAWICRTRQSARGAAGIQPWPLRRTLLCTGLLLTLFGAGIACIGSAHQLTWLASFDEPWIDTMHPRMRAQVESIKLVTQADASHWNAVQLRQAAHARTAHHLGRFQFYVATDKSGEWRGVVAVRNGVPLSVSVRDDAYYNEQYESLDDILRHFTAMEPAPQKAVQP